MTTTLRDPWATLPTHWRTPVPTPNRPSSRPTPRLKLPDTTCNPHCAHCRRPEPHPPPIDGPMWRAQEGTEWKDGNSLFLMRLPRTHGAQADCLWICDRITEPSRAQVCITTIRATARTVTAGTGRKLLVVDVCPHCGRPHIHSADPGAGRYRRAGCGHPYVLEITP